MRGDRCLPWVWQPQPALLTQVINVFFLYYPPLGTARSDVLTYMADHDGRLLSVLAGLLACFGDMAQFLAGQAVGYAVRPSATGFVSSGRTSGVVERHSKHLPNISSPGTGEIPVSLQRHEIWQRPRHVVCRHFTPMASAGDFQLAPDIMYPQLARNQGLFSSVCRQAASVVQAYPLVGALFGLLFFREYRGVSRMAQSLLAAQVRSPAMTVAPGELSWERRPIECTDMITSIAAVVQVLGSPNECLAFHQPSGCYRAPLVRRQVCT